MNLLATLCLMLATAAATPVQLIVDTDLGFDVDDVGAIAIANRLQDIGECELLAVVHNTGFYKGIGGVDVVNNWYNATAPVKLGAYTGAWGSSDDAQAAQDSYTSTIEGDFPSAVQNYDQVPNATWAYEQALSQAEDGSVVIASIGELTNLRDILMANTPLFSRKVTRIVFMDGGYNFGCGDSDGSGWSPWLGSTDDCYGSAQYVVDHVDTTVTELYFSPVGGDVYTGGRFTSGCGDGPVKEAYQIWTGYGSRPSWDPMAVVFAVRGADALYSSAEAGKMTVDWYGSESWDSSVDGYNHWYISYDESENGDITKQLDDLLCAAPCRSSTQTVGGCSGYGLRSMMHCYGGQGGDDIDPSDDPAGSMTLAECQALCDATDACDAVTVTPDLGNAEGHVLCFRVSNVTDDDMDSCAFDFAWDTHIQL